MGVEDLDSVESRLLGHAVCFRSHCPGYVCAVAIAIAVGAVCIVGGPDGAALEVGVGGVDTSVDDVRARAGTGAVIVGVGGRSLGLGRETSQAPRSVALRDISVDGEDGLLLNILDLYHVSANETGIHFPGYCATYLREVAELLEEVHVKFAGEALEALVAVDKVGLFALAGDAAQGSIESLAAGTLLQLDDVLAGDDLASARLDKGSALVDGARGRRSGHRRGDEGEEGSRELHFEGLKRRI